MLGLRWVKMQRSAQRELLNFHSSVREELKLFCSFETHEKCGFRCVRKDCRIHHIANSAFWVQLDRYKCVMYEVWRKHILVDFLAVYYFSIRTNISLSYSRILFWQILIRSIYIFWSSLQMRYEFSSNSMISHLSNWNGSLGITFLLWSI
jgi:hypothetical protein